MNGWMGWIGRVDLSGGRAWREELPPEARELLGGVGLGYWVCWREVPAGTSAFDPRNALVLAAGPLTGTEAPGSARLEVVGRSPQTHPRELFVQSGLGGDLPVELRGAGLDALVVTGQAPEPVFIYVHEQGIEIREAKELWGLDALETQERVRELLGDRSVRVLAIGPAGERLVRFACIVEGDGHAAGQGGFGAVMGSKRLKAIAVRGRAVPRVASPGAFRDACDRALRLLTMTHGNPKSAYWVRGVDALSTSLGQHWRRYDQLPLLAPGLLPFRRGKQGCCPLRCYDELEVPGVGRGIMMCVQFYWCLVGRDGPVAFLAKDLADRYGINVYELYLMVPWLRALAARGVLGERDLPFSAWPSERFVRALLSAIARREGIGDLLAEGTARAAERLGVYEELCREELVEWMALPPERVVAFSSYGGHGFCGHYDPRNWLVDGLLWATHTRDPHNDHHNYVNLTFWSGLGLDEQRAIAAHAFGSPEAVYPPGRVRYSPEEARAAMLVQHQSAVKDSLVLCDWAWPMVVSPYPDRHPPYMGDLELEAQLLSAATGWQGTREDLYGIGERIVNLARLLLVRELGGADPAREHDVLPDHFFLHPCPATGAPPLDRDRFEELKRLYYRMRGWDERGVPRAETLKRLRLR